MVGANNKAGRSLLPLRLGRVLEPLLVLVVDVDDADGEVMLMLTVISFDPLLRGLGVCIFMVVAEYPFETGAPVAIVVADPSSSSDGGMKLIGQDLDLWIGSGLSMARRSICYCSTVVWYFDYCGVNQSIQTNDSTRINRLDPASPFSRLRLSRPLRQQIQQDCRTTCFSPL